MRSLLLRAKRRDPAPSAPPPDARLCVHGLFRSGTNFFRALVETNLDCKVEYDDFGWKHAFFPIATGSSRIRLPQTRSVLVTKNPLAALESLYRYASGNPRNVRCEHGPGLSGFLRAPILVFDGSNPASVEYRFRSPVDYWNAMNWNLFSLVRKSDRALHVRYEDLVAGPEASLDRVAAAFGLGRRAGAAAGAVVVPERRMRNLGSGQHDADKFYGRESYDRSGFLAAGYAAAFGPDDLAYLDAELCWPLVEDLGYAEACRTMIDGAPAGDG